MSREWRNWPVKKKYKGQQSLAKSDLIKRVFDDVLKGVHTKKEGKCLSMLTCRYYYKCKSQMEGKKIRLNVKEIFLTVKPECLSQSSPELFNLN